MKALNKVCRATTAVGIALALAGCAGQAEKDQAEDMSQETMASQPAAMDEASAAKTTLAGWKGTWNDFSSYLDKDEVADAYDEAAKMNKTTAEDVKAELKEKRSCEFHGLKIEGDTVSFLDGFESEGGTEIAKATYECVDSKKVMHGGRAGVGRLQGQGVRREIPRSPHDARPWRGGAHALPHALRQ